MADDRATRQDRPCLDVIQRHVVDYMTEATLAVVELPSEDMKGRIIGREGRNIRAFEQTTGVDLIVDETPEAVVISCFDPVRRETARLTLMNLMLDGRIHPGRIEELHEKATQEVSRMIQEAGERAIERADVGPLPPKVVETMGRLALPHELRPKRARSLRRSVAPRGRTWRTSWVFNAETREAGRLSARHRQGARSGMGRVRTPLRAWSSCGRWASGSPSSTRWGRTINDDRALVTPEAVLVIVADTLSAARPGARRESLENHLKRLTALETIANSFPGVERSYAVQAGREVRLIVKPEQIDDLGARRLARQVAKRIEGELEYPGQIKVTVVRETRASEIAK